MRTGTLHGYHRQFCFWSKIGRGTPENPGMMLALDRGGSRVWFSASNANARRKS